MMPDDVLNHLEAELARCRDDRDRMSAELDAVMAERDRAMADGIRLDRMLLIAERERDWLRGELLSVVGSKSWHLTRPLRRALGSDRPEKVDPP